MNYIYQHRKLFEATNYVLKADTSTGYWVGISRGRIEQYKNRFTLNFNIIIYGNEQIEGDFYVIPYSAVQDIFTIESMYKGRERWVADIKNHIIRFRVSNIQRNLSQYYSIPLTENLSKTDIIAKELRNDYAIENAKREIYVRLKQSLFRKEVLKNFGNKCCLSNVSEGNLLVASHIIPWSEKIETRLSPHNGLCLSVLYDSLFDKGFFTLNNNYEVIITSKINTLSLQTKKWLSEIYGKRISQPFKYEVSNIALEYHRDNIFEKFNG